MHHSLVHLRCASLGCMASPAPEEVAVDWHHRVVQGRPNALNMHHVYVLFSELDRRLYIGSTGDIERRLQAHNFGLTPSTKYRRPLQLLFYEAYQNKLDALRRERYLKTTKGKVNLRYMLRETLQSVHYEESLLSNGRA